MDIDVVRINGTLSDVFPGLFSQKGIAFSVSLYRLVRFIAFDGGFWLLYCETLLSMYRASKKLGVSLYLWSKKKKWSKESPVSDLQEGTFREITEAIKQQDIFFVL